MFSQSAACATIVVFMGMFMLITSMLGIISAIGACCAYDLLTKSNKGRKIARKILNWLDD